MNRNPVPLFMRETFPLTETKEQMSARYKIVCAEPENIFKSSNLVNYTKKKAKVKKNTEPCQKQKQKYCVSMHTYSLWKQGVLMKESRDLHALTHEARIESKQYPDEYFLLKDAGYFPLFDFHYIHHKNVDEALLLCIEYHKEQKRKGDLRPYIEHPLRVAYLTSQMTHDPDTIAAALGHDLLEDTLCDENTIVQRCNALVLIIIQSVSEEKDVPDWKERKIRYIHRVDTSITQAHFVCLADKIANMESLQTQYHLHGDSIWNHFNKKDDTKTKKAWFERSVLKMLHKKTHISNQWLDRYENLIKEVYNEEVS